MLTLRLAPARELLDSSNGATSGARPSPLAGPGRVNEMTGRWTDDHCHLGWAPGGHDADVDGDPEADGDADGSGLIDGGFAERLDGAVADAQQAGVERMITVGTDETRSAQAIAAAHRHPGVVWATVGLHPHEASHRSVDRLTALLDDPTNQPAVVAVGECGLDYHYEHSPREVQREMFAAQIAVAHERDLALVIHTREAWDDTFAILDAEGVPERTVLHCFTGGPDELARGLDRGMFVSFSGIVTFGGAGDVRAAAKLCPLDRVLVETDSPYLAPVPHRGKPNRPALVPLVGAAVAEAMGRPVDDVAAATWDNTTRAYGLPT
jgi:TatD DNase family protein